MLRAKILYLKTSTHFVVQNDIQRPGIGCISAIGAAISQFKFELSVPCVFVVRIILGGSAGLTAVCQTRGRMIAFSVFALPRNNGAERRFMNGEGQLPALSSRQEDILTCIVQAYSERAEPVGSRYLVENYQLNVSSATVRNEMARLEELGYIAAPHRSAGRVPTAVGFRYFVRRLLQTRSLTRGEQSHISERVGTLAGGHGAVDAADGRPAGALGAVGLYRDAAHLADEFLQASGTDLDSRDGWR